MNSVTAGSQLFPSPSGTHSHHDAQNKHGVARASQSKVSSRNSLSLLRLSMLPTRLKPPAPTFISGLWNRASLSATVIDLSKFALCNCCRNGYFLPPAFNLFFFFIFISGEADRFLSAVLGCREQLHICQSSEFCTHVDTRELCLGNGHQGALPGVPQPI